MSPQFFLTKLFFLFEDKLVNMLLRSPGFHNGVRKIHRTIEDARYGRDPHEPLRPGEATEEQAPRTGFFRHFVDELKNQARGTPTDPDLPPHKPRAPERTRR